MIFKDKYIYCVLWPFSVMSSKAYTYINGTSGYFFNGTFFMFWVKLWGNMKICATWNTSSGSIQKRHLEESTIKEYSRNPKDFFLLLNIFLCMKVFLGITILILFFFFNRSLYCPLKWKRSDSIMKMAFISIKLRLPHFSICYPTA